MDLEQWNKDEDIKRTDCIVKIMEKLDKGKKIDWFDDFLWEYRDLNPRPPECKSGVHARLPKIE